MDDSSSTERVLTTLRGDIALLSAGDRLPSSRDVIARLGVSPVTVARAIARLAGEGVVVTRPGSGTFVAATPATVDAPPDRAWQAMAMRDRDGEAAYAVDTLSAPNPDAIALGGGYLPRSLQPTRALAAALARAARRPDAWDRAPVAGLPSLRALFARMSGGDVTADDVLVTSGAQSSMSLAFRAIAAPGHAVLVDSPTYPGAIAAARSAGLRTIPVPIDGDGVRPDLLADAFARSGARVYYAQPTFHNPTGCVLAPERRRQVIDVARAAGAFILEDDCARHLGHGGPVARPLVADDRDGHVVSMLSLTKPASPSLRVGALIGRGPVMQRLRAMRLVDDFFVARPLQEAAVELVSAPAWDRHLRALAAALRERCAALAAGIARERPDWRITALPLGGMHLWVEVPASLGDVEALARAQGVAVHGGGGCFPAEAPGNFVRLTFGAPADMSVMAEGLRRLRQLEAPPRRAAPPRRSRR